MTTPPAGSTPPGGSSHIRTEPTSAAGSFARRLVRPAQVIIVSSVMFTFISYWRTAAVVLCDLASTAYYIGGIVEQAIGPAAPWYILAVMLFSYAVRSVYIESCSLFVRGGVYRVVKEAMGGFLGKLSVSALMFDYILTGPTSGVSAGQYIMGLMIDSIKIMYPEMSISDDTREWVKRWGAVLIAVLITLYFFRQNLLGIHESSDKALKIMIATTIMAAVMLIWCFLTLAIKGPANPMPSPIPDLQPKVEYEIEKEGTNRVTGEVGPQNKRDEEGQLVPQIGENGQPVPAVNKATGEQEDPLGFIGHYTPSLAEKIRQPGNWFSLFGLLGLFIAFGHSILAMSGEETLAQVYREVESPKLPNFKKAAFIVFVYSLGLTATISFLAVMLIPDEVRMKNYSDNLIGGLAMHVWGHPYARLALNAFVVIVGFLILAGAVNTAIIGSNGVLNRVAEDGVLPDWFLKPHPRYGTTYRLLLLIVGLQLFTILFSRGNMIILGEAYAFGVVWSFVFKALAMVVLRFRDRSPRQYKVPFNIKIGSVEFPIGLSVIFLILLFTALLNFFTKEVATIGGLAFTAVFLTTFMVSEHYHEKRRKGKHHHHLEQFNRQTAGEVTAQSLGLTKSYRKLVAIRSPHNLFMLEKALAEADPATTGIVVMTAKHTPVGSGEPLEAETDLDTYDQQLMTAVVELAEKAGKQVKPLIVPTNNPLHAVLTTAKDIQAHEVIMGASNRYTADEQLEQIAFYWINLHGGNPAPITVRILSRERDMYLDLAGGNRIPKISERKARSVAELRAAGIGVDRVLLIHDGSPSNSDLFQGVLTMLDPQVVLGIVPVVPPGAEPLNGHGIVHQDEERARQLGRELQVISLPVPDGRAIVERAGKDQYDLIILPLSDEAPNNPVGAMDERSRYIVRHAHCRVFLAAHPVIPQEVVDKTPSSNA
jgi:amino acid transporter/nucleotide-binding universal stress UspA family protein